MKDRKVRKATWLGRAGESWVSAKGTGLRWDVHRWADTGETTARLIEGDGRTPQFRELQTIDLGVTTDIHAAIAQIQLQNGGA